MVALKDGTGITMKCANALAVLSSSLVATSQPPPPLASTASSRLGQCLAEESLDNKDMQLIYNKKRRYHHQPHRLSRSSPPTTRNASIIMGVGEEEANGEGEMTNENDEDNDDDDIDEDEEYLRMGEKFKLSAQKSKLLLPPNLYKSFLANAFRSQKSNALSKSPVDSDADYMAFSGCSTTNFNGGLHIFPRNLLFSCSVDRKSPPPSKAHQSWPTRPKLEPSPHSSPTTTSAQEVHTTLH